MWLFYKGAPHENKTDVLVTRSVKKSPELHVHVVSERIFGP